jgi:hypothetical protein
VSGWMGGWLMFSASYGVRLLEYLVPGYCVNMFISPCKMTRYRSLEGVEFSVSYGVRCFRLYSVCKAYVHFSVYKWVASALNV